MTELLPGLLGGVGLFLLGMTLMSDGLAAAAGGGLRRLLARLTGTPLKAFLSGAGLTAVVQSSSATTVTTIGFVSAGLLPFAAALGVIVGANVGTTSTGWIVSLLGFRLNLLTLALPLIGVGALARLLSRGRGAQLGTALAGFGLIFVGIDVLQASMGGLAQTIDFSGFTPQTVLGRLALVGIGAAMTVLLQSSSAAVAITLTALFGGAIDLTQAAYLVVGQNLGTTVKAVLAAIGASVAARRTALAHILFNVLAALIALLALGPLLAASQAAARWAGNPDPAFVLTLFHTLFNVLGAAVFMALLSPFARLIVRLMPDRGPALTRHLDASVLNLPEVALGATERALRDITALGVRLALAPLAGQPAGPEVETARTALHTTHAFLGRIPASGEAQHHAGRLALLHAGDHTGRLLEACAEVHTPGALRESPPDSALHGAAALARTALERLSAELPRPERHDPAALAAALRETAAEVAERRRHQRQALLADTAAGRLSPEGAQRELEAMRWVDRVLYHGWRAAHHLAHPRGEDGHPPSEAYLDLDAAPAGPEAPRVLP